MAIDDRIENTRKLLGKMSEANRCVGAGGNTFKASTINDIKDHVKNLADQAKDEIDSIKDEVDNW